MKVVPKVGDAVDGVLTVRCQKVLSVILVPFTSSDNDCLTVPKAAIFLGGIGQFRG